MAENEMILQGNEVIKHDPLKDKLITKRRRVTLPQWGVAWLVLIPALIMILMFMLYPIINTTIYAFIQDATYTRHGGSFALGQFVAGIKSVEKAKSFGLSNFQIVLKNKTFTDSIINTAILVIFEVPLTIIVSLLIATFLNSIKVLKGFYQTIFFLPYVTNTIALGLVFNLAFSDKSGGLVNILLTKLGIIDANEPINWLVFRAGDAATRFHQGIVIVTYSLWNGIAFKILVFMSGLATIDSQYYNAAKIDGASNFTIWRRITLPLLSPQILYITITSFIGAFKMYTGVLAVYQGRDAANPYYFGGEKGYEWMPVVGWIYQHASGDYFVQPGISSAASIVLLCIIMVITAVQFVVSKKRVHY